MSDLVAIAYDDLPQAQRVASNIGEAAKGHLIEIDDLVIIERRDDGKVKLHQPSLAGSAPPAARSGAASSASSSSCRSSGWRSARPPAPPAGRWPTPVSTTTS